MRVLVVTNDLPPQVGGIEYYVDQLCRGLCAAGDEVLVFASDQPGASSWDAAAPFSVVREPTSTLLPTATVRRHVLRLVEHFRPDVVLFGAAMPLGLLGPAIVSAYGVPYVAFTHGLEVSAARMPGGRKVLRRIGRSAAAITFVSDWCERLLMPAFGPGPRYRQLAPAVDPAAFHDGVDGTAVRDRYGFGDDPVVVSVARLVERKGQDQLIRALPELRARVEGARLLIVGDGPYRQGLVDLAREQGVEGYVTFAGRVDDAELPEYFAAGDLFSMPCRERRGGLEVEAFGIVFIQAQGVGRPVVAGDIGGVPDALDHGSTGLLVDGRSTDALTDALASILGDPSRATDMGAAAAAFVASRFTWQRRTDELRSLLSEVAAV